MSWTRSIDRMGGTRHVVHDGALVGAGLTSQARVAFQEFHMLLSRRARASLGTTWVHWMQ